MLMSFWSVAALKSSSCHGMRSHPRLVDSSTMFRTRHLEIKWWWHNRVPESEVQSMAWVAAARPARDCTKMMKLKATDLLRMALHRDAAAAKDEKDGSLAVLINSIYQNDLICIQTDDCRSPKLNPPSQARKNV